MSWLVEEYGRIDFLKMDIEGYEFDVLAAWTSEVALPRQVAVEIHGENLYYGTSSFRNPASQENLFMATAQHGSQRLGAVHGAPGQLGVRSGRQGGQPEVHLVLRDAL